MALALTAPWPSRTADQLESEADDRAFEAQASAPNPAGKILRIAIPAVIVVVMVVVGLSIFLSTQSSAPAPGAAPPSRPAAPAAPAKKK